MSGAIFVATSALVSQGSKRIVAISWIFAIRAWMITSPVRPAVMVSETIVGRRVRSLGVAIARLATTGLSVRTIKQCFHHGLHGE